MAGTTTFAVSNAGGGTLNWTATVVSEGRTIVGFEQGREPRTMPASCRACSTTTPRVGTIRVTAAGAEHRAEPDCHRRHSSLVLGLTAERLVERAWIIQREYGKLTVTVSNPGLVPDRQLCDLPNGRQRHSGDRGASIRLDGRIPWVYNDTFLENGTSYTYRILALDAQGLVVETCNPHHDLMSVQR